MLEDHGLFFFLVYFLLADLLGGDARLCTPPYRRKQSRSNRKGGNKSMKTKIGVIFLVMIMSLAGVGASYAAWYDQTEITTTATTGTLSYKIADISVHDQTPSAITISANPVSGEAWKKWTLTVTGAYPGWEGRVLIEWENTGSIPLEFDSFKVTVNDGWALSAYYNLKFYYGSGWTSTNLDDNLQSLHNQGWKPYSDLGVGPGDTLINAGGTGYSVVGLKLSDTLTDYQATTIIFTVQHKVTQAV